MYLEHSDMAFSCLKGLFPSANLRNVSCSCDQALDSSHTQSLLCNPNVIMAQKPLLHFLSAAVFPPELNNTFLCCTESRDCLDWLLDIQALYLILLKLRYHSILARPHQVLFVWMLMGHVGIQDISCRLF